MALGKLNKGFILLVIVGLLGTVLFFPVNLDSQYTCLFHRMMGGGHPGMVTHSGHLQDALLHRYVLPFGIIWWTSIGLVALGFYLRKVSVNSDKKES